MIQLPPPPSRQPPPGRMPADQPSSTRSITGSRGQATLCATTPAKCGADGVQ
jgi:hypothetical protein